MTDNNEVSGRGLLNYIGAFIRDRFNLDEDKANEKKTVEEIERGVEFSGINLWILIFAIMVCSVGLNVNSTAVVIGAMLISPIMGPIMGVGLGLGTNNFELIVSAILNLGIAVIICVLVSALYFWISPLDDAQSELLARTEPTLFDVLIALFGGLAGIVAGSAKEKSNAIPGVAIATALMPPLCTAGFGLATFQWSYFWGALYLFLINSVFISLSTYVIVLLLGFSKKEFIDPKREKRVRGYISFFALVIIIPSILTAINLVDKSIFIENANNFISKEIKFENCQVIDKNISFDRGEQSSIEIILYGEPVDSLAIEEVKKRMVDYNLEGTKLHVRQGYQNNDEGIDLATLQKMNEEIKTGIIEDIYKKNEEQLLSKDNQITLLRDELIRLKSKEAPMDALINEVKAINPNVLELSVSETIISQVDSLTHDTLYLAYAHFRRRPNTTQKKQLEEWLKARVKAKKLRLITN